MHAIRNAFEKTDEEATQEIRQEGGYGDRAILQQGEAWDPDRQPITQDRTEETTAADGK